MNLKEIRTILAKTTGRTDLGDDGLNYHINAGVRFLQQRVVHGEKEPTLAILNPYNVQVVLPRVRTIENVYLVDCDITLTEYSELHKRTPLTRVSREQLLSVYRDSVVDGWSQPGNRVNKIVIPGVETGTPEFYCVGAVLPMLEDPLVKLPLSSITSTYGYSKSSLTEVNNVITVTGGEGYLYKNPSINSQFWYMEATISVTSGGLTFADNVFCPAGTSAKRVSGFALEWCAPVSESQPDSNSLVSVFRCMDGTAATITNLRLGPCSQNFSTMGNRTITVMPPVAESKLLIVYGDILPPDMCADTDLNWWTMFHPDMVVRAAAYSIDSHYRNSQGMNDWMMSLAPDLDEINKDGTESSLPTSMRMLG